MKKMILILIFILIYQNLTAQTFRTSVSKNPVHVGERFEISFTLNAQGGSFKAPSFSGIRILSGPNQSQQMSFANGRSSVNLTYSYIAVALNEGEITIPSASIKTNGKTIKSNTITIEVLPETEAQKRRKEQKKKQEQSLQQQAIDILKKTIFVDLNVNKSNVYEGEQLIATYKLYIHPDINIVNIKPGTMPVFEGFWAEEIDLGRIEYKTEYRNDVPFRAAVIKKVVLTPQKSGRLKIDPYDFEFTARLRVQGGRRSNDIFDQFFNDPFFGGNYRDFPYNTSSGSATINVKSLPDNAPESFYGAVGDISTEIWFDKTKTKTGEPVTLKMKLSGKGNLKLLSTPEITFPPSFELYDPKVTDNIRINSYGMSGDVIFEYLAIPTNPGTYEIGPVSFSYFDLNDREYKTNKSKLFEIKVEKGKDVSGGVITGVEKSDVELIGKDIRFIKTGGELQKNQKKFFGTGVYYIFNLLPFIIFLGFLIYRKKNQELQSNTTLLRNKKASKTAKKRLSIAEKYLKEQNKAKLYEELSRALWGYTSDKLSIPVSELTKDKINGKLNELNIKPESIEKLLTTLDHCEFARYAPTQEGEDMQKTYNDSADIIIDLEGQLK